MQWLELLQLDVSSDLRCWRLYARVGYVPRSPLEGSDYLQTTSASLVWLLGHDPLQDRMPVGGGREEQGRVARQATLDNSRCAASHDVDRNYVNILDAARRLHKCGLQQRNCGCMAKAHFHEPWLRRRAMHLSESLRLHQPDNDGVRYIRIR
jgi:hypothetical protein